MTKRMRHPKTRKILVVEDDALFADIYAARFSEEGFEVLTANNGEDAFQKLKDEHPDLVLLDLVLPRKTGFEFLEAVRAEADPAVRDVPVIVVSNLNQESYVRRMETLGVKAYFLKADVVFSAVLEKVREIVGD